MTAVSLTNSNLPSYYIEYAEVLATGNADFNTIKAFADLDEPFAYTELGNAKRLPELTKGHLVWVPEIEKFAVYKNGRWKTDEDFAHFRVIDLLLENLNAEIGFYAVLIRQLKGMAHEHNAKPVLEEFQRRMKAIRSHMLASQRKSVITATMDLFKAQPGISVSYKDFDSKGHYLGCTNGIVDLRTGEFIENDPAYLMMKSAAVVFDSKAECPKFLAFLNEIFQGDQDKIDYQQQILGQACIGSMNKDTLTLEVGDGANGKSVKNDLAMQILGDYAAQVSPDAFMGKTDKPEYVQANLLNVRFVCMNESERGDKLAGAVVKSCVDSGMVTARHPYGRGFQYQPFYTPVLLTNFMPYISLDPAIWRRIKVIPFDYTVPKEKRDPNLRKKLFDEEAAGVLNWMIAGAMRVLEQGKVIVPQSILDIQDGFKLEFDKVGQFLNECCVERTSTKPPEKMKVRITPLRKGYDKWCKDNGYRATSTRDLRAELEKKGFRIAKSTGGHEYVYGVEIKDFGDSISLILPEDESQSLMDL
ncbi:DNA primase family protein [Pseudocolwellia agarivorans]|uniref:DNA primase family protein n=1 Tax=Pseudocolwellia agarivorans TaxID=1911682 RepID=UPI000984AEDE|nr:phage/plasmid primase, P4 family [Pseudocolwellia agarivorans]